MLELGESDIVSFVEHFVEHCAPSLPEPVEGNIVYFLLPLESKKKRPPYRATVILYLFT
jgi:hypothetical protein